MPESLAERVLRTRTACGLSQNEAAERAGLSNAYLSHLERGLINSPSVATLAKLAKGLCVSPGWLLDGSGAPSFVRFHGQPCVYFVQQGSTGPIKIGRSKNPRYRVRELSCGSCEPLNLLATTPGWEAEERALHMRFAQHRIRGEWFAPAPELVSLIEEINARAA